MTLSDGSDICLGPFVYLKEADQVLVERSNGSLKRVVKIVQPASEEEASVDVFPPYERMESVHFPPQELVVTFRERASRRDWGSAKQLTQFHYRGKGLNRIVGHRTALMVDAVGVGTIGYGVLSSTVAAAKPRFAIFGNNFGEQMRSKLINRIVRIPRVVIHPEFRGIGLGAKLAEHLVEYARLHWDINGYKPILVEVIASMTMYHKFFLAAGFVEAGRTLGYEKGILPQYGSGGWEERPNVGRYDLFKNQGPKPYIVFPLTEHVAELVRAQTAPQKRPPHTPRRHPQLKSSLKFKKVSVAYETRNLSTERTEGVRTAFDVNSVNMTSPIISEFSLTIDPGDFVLVTGASGTGKTSLINLLDPGRVSSRDLKVTGSVPRVSPSDLAVLDHLWDDGKPLVDQVGATVGEAIEILNSVGLSEAHLYLKRPTQLSDGQRYRFSIARLCDSGKPLWIGDEFASTLDPRTAAIVAKGLRRRAAKQGATVILAAPHIGHFAASLAANKLVVLRWGGSASILAVKLRQHPRGSGRTEVWARNMGQSKLTGVHISLFGRHGRLLASPDFVGTLAPGEGSRRVTIASGLREQASIILLTTEQGPGDLTYLSA